MDDLDAQLAQWVEASEPITFDEVTAHPHVTTRRRGRALVVAGVGLLAALALVAALAVARTDGSPDRIETVASTAPTAEYGYEWQLTTIAIEGSAGIGIVAEGDLWMTFCCDQDGTGDVTRIDAATGRVLDTVTAIPEPDAITATQDAIWVIDHYSGDLFKIDRVTAEVVAEVPVGMSGGTIDATAEAVWVLSDTGFVQRVDPESAEIVESIPIESDAMHVAATSSDVWVAHSLIGLVTRIDARTNEVVAEISVEAGEIHAIDALGDQAWVSYSNSDTDGFLARIDGVENRVADVIELDGPSFTLLLVDNGTLLAAPWFAPPASAPARIVVIDTAGREVVTSLTPGGLPHFWGTDGDAVWGSYFLGQSLFRIERVPK